MSSGTHPEQQELVDKLLLEAFLANDQARVNLCLKKGADIRMLQPSTKRNFLMLVVLHQPWNIAFLEKMLNVDLDIFAKDGEGKNVFDHAQAVRNEETRKTIMDMLLKRLPDAPPPSKKPANDFNEAMGPITLDKALPPAKPLTFPKKSP